MMKYIVATFYFLTGIAMNLYFKTYDIGSFYLGFGLGALLTLLFHKPQTKSMKL